MGECRNFISKPMTPSDKVDRQREHQANERTFLAWLRTAIALIGFGFAIARFGLFLRQIQTVLTQPNNPKGFPVSSENLGIGLVVLGILVVTVAAWRYNQVYHQIEAGNYRPNRMIVWIITAIVTIFGLLSIPLLMLREKTPTPPRPEGRRLYKSPAYLSDLKRWY